MSLLRAAFECENDTIQLVVLCIGCYSELIERAPSCRHWCSELDVGICEFCQAEIREAAITGH